MKRNIIFMVITILICTIYINGMNILDSYISKGSKPSIQINSDVIEVSVHAATSALLKGVKATDKEDGDITANIIVESISSFDERNERTISYAVFDNDNNVSRMIRKLRYTDYSAPTFSIEKPLIAYTLPSNEELAKYVKATSSIDGDLSAFVKVDNVEYKDLTGYVTFSVKDSCNNTVLYKQNITLVNKPIMNEIELSTYEVTLPAGTSYFNARSYISGMRGTLGNMMGYLNQVNIVDNVNYDVPGTYDIIYTFTSEDDGFGATKLVVNIE